MECDGCCKTVGALVFRRYKDGTILQLCMKCMGKKELSTDRS